MLFGIEKDLVGTGHRLTCDQVAQSRVAAFLNRRIEADVVAAIAHQIKDAFGLKIHLGCDLLDLRIPTEPTLESPPHGAHLIDLLGHMHRKSNDATLLGDPPADRLPYPPGSIRGELEALRVVKLLNCTDKTRVAFLHQIQKG